MAFKALFNALFAVSVNGSIFKTRLLTVGGIICLILDKIDGYADYWFNYGKFK